MQTFKKIFLTLWCIVIVFLVFICAIADKYTVPVMMYHNVADSKVYRDDTVSPANLDLQLKFLKTSLTVQGPPINILKKYL